MLCAYLRNGKWHSLATHRDDDGLLLIERRGACPGDPTGDVIALLGPIDELEVADRAAAWLRHGCADGSAEPPAPVTAAPAPGAGRPVAADDPGDRPLTATAARLLVAAAVNGAPAPYCVFPNRATRRC